MSWKASFQNLSAFAVVLCFLAACGSSGSGSTTADNSNDDTSGTSDSVDVGSGTSGSDDGDTDTDTDDGDGDGDGGNQDSGGGDNQSALTIIVEGQETPGIPGGTFTGVGDVDMNSSAFACFTAGYAVESTRGSAVWCGSDGNMLPKVFSGDQIDNLAANISIESVASVEVADNGNVLLGVALDGASDGTAYVEWDGQSTRSVLRVGELAPGFDEALAITSVSLAGYSSAGAVLLGTVGQFGIVAYWHWDGETVSLISDATGVMPAPEDQNGCGVRGTPFFLSNPIHINNNGEVAYVASLETTDNNTDSSVCRSTGIVIKTGDTYTTVFKVDATVPGTARADFSTPTINEFFDSGALSISSVLSDDTASGLEIGRVSHWIWGPENVANLIAITGESVPPTYDDRVQILANVPIVIAASESLAVQHAKTALGVSILAGPPHAGMPYPDIGAVGATSMSLIARSNAEAPPGFSDDTFIEEFSRPAIDRFGRVFYTAVVRSVSDNSETTALYSAQAGDEPTLLIRTGEAVQIDGVDRLITRIRYVDAATSGFFFNNSQGAFISQQGDIWLPVELDGSDEALLQLSAN